MTYEYYPKKQYVFRQGEIGDKFFIILDGVVGIIIESEGRDGKKIYKEVLEKRKGDSFGEIALNDKVPR